MSAASVSGSPLLRQQWQGRWALVTGASSGIGEALAVELAAAGVNLVLTARRADRLEALASRLQSGYGVETRVVVADLSDPAAPLTLFNVTEGSGIVIDVLVNNAGFGEYGRFLDTGLETQCSMVQVNCVAVVHLTRLFLPRMVERRRGAVLIVSSTASFQPVPYISTYAATKVFDRFFSEAVAAEMRPFGVRVSALCPGSTKSEFLDVAGSTPVKGHYYQPAAEVARRGLEALVRGRIAYIPYFGGRIQTFAQRFLPRSVVVKAAERLFRPELRKR